jgi:hypothetical protein
MILGIVCCCTVYLLPFGIALLRDRENKLMIFFLDFFGGVTIVLWVIAFFMALKARDSSAV